MRKSKKLLSLTLVLLLGLGALTGCSGKEKETNSNEIVVGATIKPHSEILKSEAVTNKLEELGYTLKVVEYTDYVQPNSATQDGSLDANFFQHQPFLDDYNAANGDALVSVAKIHYEPLGLYAGKKNSLDNIQDSVIAVPNDSSNEARVLQMLESAGLIKLDPSKGLKAIVKDITENPYNITFQEIESAQTTLVLPDVDFSVVNGNYALDAGLDVNSDALIVEQEDSIGADTYSNILVVKAGNEESEKTKVLIEAMTSDEVRTFIQQSYNGAVVPVF